MEPITTVTATVVLAMMARLPSVENPRTEAQRMPGRWEARPAAAEIAQGIADAVNADEDPLFDDRLLEASLMATYAAFEGGNLRCASGDGGHSWGPFQLADVHTPRTVACDPASAARVWVRLAHVTRCVDRPDNEALSPMASGNCAHGRVLTRRRFAHAEAIVAALRPQE